MASYLTRDTVRLLALGLVAVAAVSMGAAAVDSMTGAPGAADQDPLVNVDRNSTSPGGQGRETRGEVDRGANGTTGFSGGLSWCAPFLPSTLGSLVYFGGFIGILALLKRRYSLGVAAFAMYGMSPIVLVGYFLSTDCATGAGKDGGGGPIRDALTQASNTGLTQPDISPLWLIGILGVVLVATAAVIIRSASDQEFDPAETEEEDEDIGTEVADLAAAAGEAADRLEKHNADVDNEVYRAWWEMTSLLDVPNPHSSTPGEFAAAAIEVGMGEQYVDELTRLFEEVRYGQRDPESREERAIEVFRAIEEEYGRDGSADLDPESETDISDETPDTEENDGR